MLLFNLVALGSGDSFHFSSTDFSYNYRIVHFYTTFQSETIFGYLYSDQTQRHTVCVCVCERMLKTGCRYFKTIRLIVEGIFETVLY